MFSGMALCNIHLSKKWRQTLASYLFHFYLNRIFSCRSSSDRNGTTSGFLMEIISLKMISCWAEEYCSNCGCLKRTLLARKDKKISKIQTFSCAFFVTEHYSLSPSMLLSNLFFLCVQGISLSDCYYQSFYHLV